LAQLEAELQVLLKEAAAQGITIGGTTTTTTTVTPTTTGTGAATMPSHYVFTRNLALWDEGYDVMYLQEFLVAQNLGPAARAVKAHGLTRTYGNLTLAAVKELQESVGIPASGYFGVQTRAYVNSVDQ
jgi:peptidoglycan hydrolase-like protein with peptidoglycan-binding domain